MPLDTGGIYRLYAPAPHTGATPRLLTGDNTREATGGVCGVIVYSDMLRSPDLKRARAHLPLKTSHPRRRHACCPRPSHPIALRETILAVSDDPIVLMLLTLYAAGLALNTALSVALWMRNRTPLNGVLTRVWGTSAAAFILQAFTGDNDLAIILGFSFVFFSNVALARLVSMTLDVPLRTGRYSATLVGSCFIAVLQYSIGASFTWVALPVVVAVALPLAVTSIVAIYDRWSVMGVTSRAMVISCLFFSAHILDFAFLRPIHEATAIGFTIAFMIVFALSITVPAVVLELSAEQKTRAEVELATAQRLKRYFPKALVRTILDEKTEMKLSGERRNITVVFSDLCGFTELSDRTAPERMGTVLNEYLDAMFAIMDHHGCTLDKVMGDGIMGFFGAPQEMPQDEQAWRAVSMAVAMQRRFQVLADDWRAQGLDHDILVRIGLNQEYAMVGNFGSSDLMSYTAIGSGVNLASRLESMCPPGLILAGYSVHALTVTRFPWSAPALHEIKGFARKQKCYKLDPFEVDAESLWRGSCLPKSA